MTTEPPRQRSIRIGSGRTLLATKVFDSYWRFAALRQALFMRRVRGAPPPWTDDPVLAGHRFTNVYRASDRVSQYLIRHVLYEGAQTPEEILFRTLLFKLFNRVETWDRLRSHVGQPTWKKFDHERYAAVLDDAMAQGQRVYSAAYIMPSPSFGDARKHRNHLHLIEHMLRDGAARRLAAARSLNEAFHIIRSYPSLGDFLAFQLVIDLNYSILLNFSEMDFVVAGPGAKDGLRKCFTDTAEFSESDLIRIVADIASTEFKRLGLAFESLWGRALHLIDCQNLFCEVSKYARVVHPEFSGPSGRTRIKQKFVANTEPLTQWYPPKWKLQIPVEVASLAEDARGRVPFRRLVQLSLGTEGRFES